MSIEDLRKNVVDWIRRVGLETHPIERGLRLCEETLELVQAVGVTRGQAHVLVDYVFNRPVGDPPQELAGVMICLVALANSLGESLEGVTTAELMRINTPERIARARRRDQEKWQAGVGFVLDVPPED
jgi:NTP pyrophosphatase (non-canonical NTP hydrolase)